MALDRHSAIFRPITLGRVRCKNRIEMAPAGCFLTARGGGNSIQYMEYIKKLAAGGAAVITQGISTVDEGGSRSGRTLNVGNESFVHDLHEITECIHARDAAASIELACGKYMMAPPEQVVNETSKEDIKEIYRLFASGAERCVRSGFDMIMIHGGHGNTPAMFFSRMFNHRTDEYGGSFEGRCRFAVGLLDAIRDKVGDKLAIEYRISAEELVPGGSELEETIEFAKLIQDRIDIIHVSKGLLLTNETLPDMFPPTYLPRGLNLSAAHEFKKALHIPVSVVGGFDLDTAETAVAEGKVDMVAMVRNILADPSCVNNARRGRQEDTRPCVRCNSCIHSTHSCFLPVRCAVNPLIGRETEYLSSPPGSPAPVKKKVLIVGGGPGGLECARTASGRGHRVVLMEKSDRLGGALNMASAAEFKKDMRKYLDWSIRTVINDPNIEVRLSEEATEEKILALAPDALVVSVGAKPIIIPMPSDKSGKTVWVGDVDLGRARTGHRVVMAGAGFTGLETSLTLARAGHQVTVIDMLPADRIGADGITISMIGLRRLLDEAGVKFICQVKLEDVNGEGAVIVDKNGERRTLPCDSVVMSLGVRPDRETAEKLADTVAESYIIGDSSWRGGTLWKTVHMAFDTAMLI